MRSVAAVKSVFSDEGASTARLRTRLARSAWMQWASFTVLVLSLALIGIVLEHGSRRLVMGSPISAVALACLLQVKSSRWPAFLISVFLAAIVEMVARNSTLPSACILALFKSAQLLGAATILRRLLGEQIDLARYRDLWIFAVVVALLLPLLSVGAYLAIIMSHSSRTLNFTTFTRWGVGSALGYLLVTPAIITFSSDRLKALVSRISGRNFGVTLAIYSVVVALVSIQGDGDLRALLVPALLWLTFKLGTSGAAFGLGIQAAIATACLLMGHGSSDSSASVADQLMKLQLGLAINALCAYPIAAVLSHRSRLSQSLADSNVALEQAQRLTSIAEQLGGIGYTRFDVATGKRVLSDNLVRLLYSSGLPPEGDIHPDDIEEQAQLKQRAIEFGDDYEAYVRVRTSDGGWRTLRGRHVCEKDADGKVAAIVGVLIDVTDMQLADQALRASETRYRLLAEHSNDMIILTDREDRITYVSPAIVALTGAQPEDALGQVSQDVIRRTKGMHGAGAHDLAGFGNEQDAQRQGMTLRVRHLDGRWIWLETRSALLRDPETGEVTGMMHVSRDVTERQAMEEELQRKCQEAEAATVAKSEFLANMSHEIRTPLTGIIGFSDLLHKMAELPDDALRFADRIHTAGGALLAIVNDILDVSKLEAGQLELDPQPVEPERFIRETADLVMHQAAQKGLELSVSFGAPSPDWILADSVRLRQVLMNLLTNAIKFTKAGEVSVEADYDAVAGQLRVAVRDTGQGIPLDRRGRLFQRFSQVDGSISRVHGGSGLGLAICKRLTELMGGTIDVDSAEGVGSVFRFVIDAPAAEAPATARGESDSDREAGFRPAHILVVDDVPVNRELVRAMLGVFGHTFVQAENGVDAVRRASEQVFDLILMDMQMPGMDGLAASRAIRSDSLNRATPIVALSANVLPTEIAACRAAGMNDHIAKPINSIELLTKVAQWTEGQGDIEVESEAAAQVG